MTAIANRKQRLRTLENQIRKAANEIQKNGLEIGRDLCEIRDNELWAEDYDSWNQYLKERAGELVGKSFSRAAALMQAAEIEKRIPDTISPDVRTNLPASAITELGRLAPTVGKDGERGAEKDYSRLKKTDLARVLKAATKSAGDKVPSVRDIRKAVDDDLGIDRATQAAETKKRREHDRQIDLPDFLRQETGKLEATINILAKVPAEGWEQLAESHPGLAERLAAVCDELAEFLRS